MFEALEPLSPDPILGLMAAFREDARAQKIDLGVGVYRDEAGDTPIMKCVGEAEQRRFASETTKSYIGPPGTPEFNDVARALMFGAGHAVLRDKRVAGVQTPGGCGALRVGAELIKRARPATTIWVSSPTWANHVPLLGNAGLAIQEYAYYAKASHSLDADGMLAALAEVPAGDVVLLHGCCHNPSGVDLKAEHWHAVARLANERGFTPFIDLAYQGLGDGIEEDAAGVRILGEACPELIVASSYSKNFGLYRERVGALQIVSPSTQQTAIVQSQLGSVVRGIYSMPPAHGAAIVEIVMNDEALRASWVDELNGMRERINGLRDLLAERLGAATGQDFGFIREQRGMFSFLGISPAQVQRLKDEFGIYMVDSSRINVAGVNGANVDYFVDAMRQVLV
ncbi:MAG: aspartate/tyrosine/aromatic aminotransferase [Gammaproteobacteria bacterium]|nr:aspartate/tyrosine/aromatic aminotransferase [Gammaproteobacteria bacterium]MCP5198954.1 aspartate/tyrosine/aromatic aminotransferase [Gammaproteobacteria bacterium]